VANRLLRLPLWLGLEDEQQRVVDAVWGYLAGVRGGVDAGSGMSA
jgi:hypothetical protein